MEPLESHSNDAIELQLRRYGLPFWSCLLNFITALVLSSTHRYPVYVSFLLCFAIVDWLVMGVLLTQYSRKESGGSYWRDTLRRSTYLMYVFSFDAMMLLSGLLSPQLWRMNSVPLPGLEAYRSTRLPLHAWLVSAPTVGLISVLLADMLRSGLATAHPAVAVCAIMALAMSSWNFLEHGLHQMLQRVLQLRAYHLSHPSSSSSGGNSSNGPTSLSTPSLGSMLLLHLRLLLQLKGRDDGLMNEALAPLAAGADVEAPAQSADRDRPPSESGISDDSSLLLLPPPQQQFVQRADARRTEERRRFSQAAEYLVASCMNGDELTIDGDMLVARFGLEAHRVHLVVVQVVNHVLMDQITVRAVKLSRMYLEHKAGRSLWRLTPDRDSPLQSISATRCFVTPEFVYYMKQACTTSLKTLKCYSCDLQDSGLALLSSCLTNESHLQHLSLTFEGITSMGLSMMAACAAPDLTTLDLQANEVGDDGAGALPALLHNWSSLESLNLARNSLGCETAKAIASFLTAQPDLPLKHLDLSFNEIDDEGASALVEALAGCGSTVVVKLQNNAISDECLQALERRCAVHNLCVHFRHSLL